MSHDIPVTDRWNWQAQQVDAGYLDWHQQARSSCIRDIVQMTHLASSGHPGGSLSSLDFYLVIYAHSNISAQDPWMHDRDRIVVSHGHTSPAVYSVLSKLDYFPAEKVVANFRRVFDKFEGHIERDIPGVEWTTGNLGQGLSAACGMALGNQLKGIAAQIFVPMGDGEQQKGQISEARRFVVKFGLNHITAIIDLNQKQIGGEISDIMPQDIAAGWASDGWKVVEIDGHDPAAIYQACQAATQDADNAYVILANTSMGKGVSFMEGTHKYHGAPCSVAEYEQAAQESGEYERWNLDSLRELAAKKLPTELAELQLSYPHLDPGTPRTYAAGEKADNRGAFGNAMLDVAEANRKDQFTPLAAFDCDLEGSVKLGAFHQAFPNNFFQAGIQEHHTASCAGALSAEDIVTVFADFGVFGVCETYNQHRLSDINHAHLKLACTHIGLDVGEDGRTHQNIDYVGLLNNIFGMKIIVPADPNQTDRALRHMLCEPGMFFLGMGRSKLPTLTDESGQPAFAGDYKFAMGQLDWLRRGKAGTIVAMGTLCNRALEAADALRAQGIDMGMAVLATPTEIKAEHLEELAQSPVLITVEDHIARSGLGANLAMHLFAHGAVLPHLRLGVENYCPSGCAEDVYASQGLDTASIEQSSAEFVAMHAKS